MILIKSAQNRYFLLRKERNRIIKQAVDKVRELSQSDQDYAKGLLNKMNKIDKLLYNSICLCKVCGSAKKDMMYCPPLEAWFCVDCYELNREYYKNTKCAELYP